MDGDLASESTARAFRPQQPLEWTGRGAATLIERIRSRIDVLVVMAGPSTPIRPSASSEVAYVRLLILC